MPKKTKDSTYSFGKFNHASIQNAKRLHMTEKPLELMRELARIARPDSSILDPFMGSGSTIHAAELEGMNATGIELTDHHYNTAVERMATYERNKPIGTIGE
jgi:site-specific DNA-methyltransferase (adenine-specific)